MIVRVLIWMVLGFLVYTAYQALRQALQKSDRTPPEKTGQGEDMIQDPQCGTYVPKTDAVSEMVNGKRRYFCSETCRDDYQSEH